MTWERLAATLEPQFRCFFSSLFVWLYVCVNACVCLGGSPMTILNRPNSIVSDCSSLGQLDDVTPFTSFEADPLNLGFSTKNVPLGVSMWTAYKDKTAYIKLNLYLHLIILALLLSRKRKSARPRVNHASQCQGMWHTSATAIDSEAGLWSSYALTYLQDNYQTLKTQPPNLDTLLRNYLFKVNE